MTKDKTINKMFVRRLEPLSVDVRKGKTKDFNRESRPLNAGDCRASMLNNIVATTSPVGVDRDKP